MAYKIMICLKLKNGDYWYRDRVPGFYNQNLSLYFAYMHSVFDFECRYCIIKDSDFNIYTNHSLLQERCDFKNKDILNILKNKNYEV